MGIIVHRIFRNTTYFGDARSEKEEKLKENSFRKVQNWFLHQHTNWPNLTQLLLLKRSKMCISMQALTKRKGATPILSLNILPTLFQRNLFPRRYLCQAARYVKCRLGKSDNFVFYEAAKASRLDWYQAEGVWGNGAHCPANRTSSYLVQMRHRLKMTSALWIFVVVEIQCILCLLSMFYYDYQIFWIIMS